MAVSAIVPAYNESDRLESVIEPLRAAPSVNEVVVADDGSIDDTVGVARGLGVCVVELGENLGKAAALDVGVKAARNETLLFLDADLVGLRPEHVELLARVYQEKSPHMVVGVFKSGRLNTDLSQSIAPYLSGQRVLSRRIWERLLERESLEFGVEMALTKLSLKEDWHEERVYLEGVTHVMKEEKRGFSEGFRQRITMYGDILRSFFSRTG